MPKIRLLIRLQNCPEVTKVNLGHQVSTRSTKVQCQQGQSKVSKVSPRSSLDHPNFILMPSQSYPKVIPRSSKCHPNVIKMSSKGHPNGHSKGIPRSSQGHSKVIPRSSMSSQSHPYHPKVIPE